VYLEGQALFDVVHDDTRPFRVHMRRDVAEDIGTRFVVKSYAEDREDRVAVVEGVVALWHSRDPVILDAGDVATIVPGAEVRAARDVDLSADTAWTGGRLVFRDTPLRHVLVELARWYDIDVKLANPVLGERLLTAEMADVPVDAVLTDLARALKLRVERVGRVFWLAER
jgi:transmembrane sensor